MHSSVRVVNHFFTKRDGQLKEDKKIHTSISKNRIKILNVWLVGAWKMRNWFREELANQMWRNCEDEK